MDCNCLSWLVPVVILLLLIIKYLLKPGMWSADGPVMRGKTVIVTGANVGIGFETAAELARYGAKIILACRDQAKAKQARQTIIDRLRDQQGQSDIEDRLIIEDLDLASFDSIRAFAKRMLQLPRLDVLINNAGVMCLSERVLTKDGLEMTMGTNHFGHFLLTNLLLPLIKKSAPSRIVVVSSMAYEYGKIDFENLNSEKSFSRFQSYGASKLANILFANELARQLEGTGVVVNSLHPGGVKTELGRHFPRAFQFLFYKVLGCFFKSSFEGAQTSIYLAASQSPEVLESGKYYKDCHVAKLAAHARDAATAKKLWEVSERITKLD